MNSESTSHPIARLTIPPLPAAMKLAALNEVRQINNLGILNVLPSPHIVLTPAQPVQGTSSFILQGRWDPNNQSVSLFNNDIDYLRFNLVCLSGKACLLDISISQSPFVDWTYVGTSGSGPLTAQQGHLVLGWYCGTDGFNWFQVSPVSGSQQTAHEFISAELTQA